MDPRYQVRNPAFITPSVGAALEQLILKNSKQYFNNSYTSKNQGESSTDKWKVAAHKIGEDGLHQNEERDMVRNDFDDLEYDDSNLCNKRCCWWSPSQDSISVAFCNETSIHGFKFLGQRKRHLTERQFEHWFLLILLCIKFSDYKIFIVFFRIFWLISFLLSLSAAVYLIYGVWERYQRVPVIVSFQSSEQDIDSIPFPAVTFCNMNKVTFFWNCIAYYNLLLGLVVFSLCYKQF